MAEVKRFRPIFNDLVDEGAKWTFASPQGGVRRYVVDRAELNDAASAIVFLRNVETDKEAMVTRRWLAEVGAGWTPGWEDAELQVAA